jgi:predicted nucleic acid-binding protein
VNFLLDTNVISEWVKPRPNLAVVEWLSTVDEDRAFLSVVTLAELRYGVERMAAGQRRRRIEEWIGDELPLRFEGRVLSINPVVANMWGRIVARSEAAGRPISATDAFIAATAETHDLTLVTRDIGDFEPVLTSIVNPWKRGSGP